MKHIEIGKTQEEEEISLVDLIQFLNQNGKLMTLMTLGLSALTIILSLLLPRQHQKQLTLSVTPVPISLSTQPLLRLDINQASNLTVELLEHYYDEIDEIDARTNYNTQTQQIDLTLRSPDTSYLEQASSKVTSLLETEFQAIVGNSIEDSLLRTELAIDKNKKILAQLEKEIAQISPPNGNDSQSRRTTLSLEALAFKLEALETKRTNLITVIAALEFDKKYLEPAQKNLAELTSQVISIKILTEYEMQPTRSLIQIGALAIIASFITAVLAAITRDQIPHLKKELSQQKPQ